MRKFYISCIAFAFLGLSATANAQKKSVNAKQSVNFTEAQQLQRQSLSSDKLSENFSNEKAVKAKQTANLNTAKLEKLKADEVKKANLRQRSPQASSEECVEDATISPTSSYQTASGSIVSEGEYVYKFAAVAGEYYEFKTGCGDGAVAEFDTKLTVFNSNCVEVGFNDDACEYYTSSLTWECETSGNYYLKVQGFMASSGSFTLAYRTFNFAEVNCTADATISPTSSYQTANGGFAVAGGGYTYKFTAVAGTYYDFKAGCGDGATTDGFDADFYLFDATCTQILYLDGDCDGNYLPFLTWKCETSGDYYLRVKGYGDHYGDFTLAYRISVPYSLTVVANSTEGTTTGSGSYYRGESVQISATAKSGYTFTGWSFEEAGEIVTRATPVIYTMEAEDVTVYANFVPSSTTYTLTLSANPSGYGTVTGAGTYSVGTLVQISAIPNEGYSFAGWSLSGSAYISSYANPANYFMFANTALVANFVVLDPNVAALTSLSVSEGTLTPAFTPYFTDYSVSVGNSVNSLAISATANNANVYIDVYRYSSELGNFELFDYGDGSITVLADELEVGENIFTVDTYTNYSDYKEHYLVITRENVLGLDEVSSANIKIYPNPVKDDLFIVSDSKIEKVELYSLTGTLLLYQNGASNRISTQSLVQGIYLLKTHTENGTVINKIVKK